MSTNKSVHDQLAQIYGDKCMFESAHVEDQIGKLNAKRKIKIRPMSKYVESRHYTRSKKAELENQMSVHHLVHRSEGGKTNVENCSIVNRLAHDYIHSLPRADEEVINDMIREFKLCAVELTTEGPVQAKAITIEVPREGDDVLVIPVHNGKPPAMREVPNEDYTDPEYLELKRKRNARVAKRFKEFDEGR